MFKTFTIFRNFFKSLILQTLWIYDFWDFMSYWGFWLYCGCMCAKPRKLRKGEQKTHLNKRAMVRLLDAVIDYNIDKSGKNFQRGSLDQFNVDYEPGKETSASAQQH